MWGLMWGAIGVAIWVGRYLSDLNKEQDAMLPTAFREFFLEFFRFLANDQPHLGLAMEHDCL